MVVLHSVNTVPSPQEKISSTITDDEHCSAKATQGKAPFLPELRATIGSFKILSLLLQNFLAFRFHPLP